MVLASTGKGGGGALEVTWPKESVLGLSSTSLSPVPWPQATQEKGGHTFLGFWFVKSQGKTLFESDTTQ